jgi:hypothetical protein
MATYKIQTFPFSLSIEIPNLREKYLSFVDSQSVNSVGWYIGSLLIQGCILVPLTFLLVYSLNGPTAIFLSISMITFFLNVIANMGGAGFRFTFNTFMFSIVLHAVMALTAIYNYYYILF